MVIVKEIPVMIFEQISSISSEFDFSGLILFYLLKFNTNQNEKKSNMLISDTELYLSKGQNSQNIFRYFPLVSVCV